MRPWYKKKRFLLPIGFAVLIALLVWQVRKPSQPAYETVTATRGDIAHVVSVTGKVEAADHVDLAFSTVGKVVGVFVEEGDHVSRGQTLASLDTSVLQAQLAQARSALVRELNTRAQLLAGTRSEDVAVTQASVDAAQAALGNAAQELARVLNKEYVVAHDAVTAKADGLFQNGTSDNPGFGIQFTSGGTTYLITADNETRATLSIMRAMINRRLAEWNAATATDPAALNARAGTAVDTLSYMQQFFTLLATAVNQYTSKEAAAQTIYATFQADVSAGRSSIATALGELKTTEDAFTSAKSSLEVAERQLVLKTAGPTSDAVKIQDAAVAAAQDAAQALVAQIAQSSLIAPITGEVTNVSLKQGESAVPNQPAVTILSPNAFDLIAYIPESDIAQVMVGDEAEVTFDALDLDQSIKAHVIQINSGETIREGVATYKTTLSLDAPNAGIRSGMSANIDITTATRTDVIILPQRSVVTNGGEHVRVPSGSTYVERTVHTGLRGSDGNTEILDGVAEGEKVILYLSK